MVVIHWEINGKTGHGSAIDYETAEAWVAEMNKKYGVGTHWLEGREYGTCSSAYDYDGRGDDCRIVFERDVGLV